MPKLVIVESPAKVKTIKSFLGRGFNVVATKGHIRDLPKFSFGIKIEEEHVAPNYVIAKENKKTVDEIKKLAKKSTTIYIATDEDREGEAIGYHVTQFLEDKDIKNYPRIVFHEITKSAILNAIKNPRLIDMNKVDAQQTRRILDRIVGYKLSPLLNSKIQRGLSAGRVQSVALKIAVDKEREIKAFKPEEYYKIDLVFKPYIPFELKEFKKDKISKLSITTEELAKDVMTSTNKGGFTITKISAKAKTLMPSPPFITSTLQQSASNKFSYSPTRTMVIAQKLYEGVSVDGELQGVITYMRTDSLQISKEAQDEALEFIKKAYGAKYLPKTPRVFKKKATGAQEAHEAIRPVNVNLTPLMIKPNMSNDEYKLYSLIYNRFLASQMANAAFDLTSIEIKNEDIMARANGRRMVFDGFYKISPDVGKDVVLPELKLNDKIELEKSSYLQQFTQPPARYSEASIIKELEKKGIGRPSTYAPTIGTLQKREYIVIEKRSIIPQKIAFTVIELLEKYFEDIVDNKFTSNLEKTLDEIANKDTNWHKILIDFYNDFMKKVDYAKENAKSLKVIIPTGEDCPECGEELVIRKGRFGEFISCSTYPKCKFSKNMKKDGEVEHPEIDCTKCGAKMAVKNSRRGQFYGCSNYPKCKNTRTLEEPVKLEIKCPKCSGDLIEKYSKRGKFYGCSNYPDCDFITKYELVKKDCPKCDSKLAYHKILKTKTSFICVNDECKHSEDTKNI